MTLQMKGNYTVVQDTHDLFSQYTLFPPTPSPNSCTLQASDVQLRYE